jgi:hypothetical protein
MAKTLQISAVLALTSAAIVFVFNAFRRPSINPEVNKFLKSPGIVERHNLIRSNTDDSHKKSTPLVKQAKNFAAYLKSPKAKEEEEEVTVLAPTRVSTSSIRSIASSLKSAAHTPKFTLHGTCYYPLKPDKSLALLWQPGGGGGTFKWVRQGAQLGHFIIQEIKPSAIVYAGGQQVGEMTIQRGSTGALLVRDDETDSDVAPTRTPVPPHVSVIGKRFLPEVGSDETTEEDASGRYGLPEQDFETL